MKTTARHETILNLLRDSSSVTVKELANRFSVSNETIRRDLHRLSRRGIIRKVHGGAVLPQSAIESEFHERMISNVAQKRAIAQVAARLFGRYDSLFIDTGSTTVFFAEKLALRGPVTVVTNSTMVATTMTTGNSKAKVFLLGGEYNHANCETVGEFVIGQIRQFHAEHAVLTAGALDNMGVMTDYSHQEALIAHAMIRQARQTTVLADSSKLNKKAIFKVAPPENFHRLVCNTKPSGRLLAELERCNVEIVLA